MRRCDDPFYPIAATKHEGYLEREDGHRIFYQQSGNLDGVPLLVCHGGPGGGSTPGLRRLLNGECFRIIQFDQRGCGRSEPAGALVGNSLAHTLNDMEALRSTLGIERWAVTGGSWGSTVALAYGEAFPHRILGLLLVSMWLCRREDTDWWFHGVRKIFPELWRDFAGLVPEEERGDLRKAYCERILGDDRVLAEEAARRLYLYEEGFMHFDAPLAPPDPARGAAYGRIFAHYASHDFFLRNAELLENADRLGDIPLILLTGRYDMCTTPDNAWDLAQRVGHADLRVVAGGGHYPTELAMAVACVRAGEDFLRLCQQRLGS